jgi:hypothetical protein
MSMTARFWQVEGGSGPAWKEPPGDAPDDLDEDELDDDGRLDLDVAWRDVEAVFEALDVKVPWAQEMEELEPADVQRLATRLKPLTWASVVERGVVVDDLPHPDGAQAGYELFRRLIIDTARGGNGLAWEID